MNAESVAGKSFLRRSINGAAAITPQPTYLAPPED